jgi:hypothetical protein
LDSQFPFQLKNALEENQMGTRHLLIGVAVLVAALLGMSACGGGDDESDQDEVSTSAPQTAVPGETEETGGPDSTSTEDDDVAECPIVSVADVSELLGQDFSFLQGGADETGAECRFKAGESEYPQLLITVQNNSFTKTGRLAYFEQLDGNQGWEPEIMDVEGLGDEAFSRSCCPGVEPSSYSIEAFREPFHVQAGLTYSADESISNPTDVLIDIVRGVLEQY